MNGENMLIKFEKRVMTHRIGWAGGPCIFGLNMPINFNKVQLTSVVGFLLDWVASTLIRIANVIIIRIMKYRKKKIKQGRIFIMHTFFNCFHV